MGLTDKHMVYGDDIPHTIAEKESYKAYKASENELEKLLTHIFELSYALDTQSAGKDFLSLRTTHYDNQEWIHDNGYQEKYYQYFISKRKEGTQC